jgi:ubiquinone/menaquinone biosynthesis C-methylase UbiE
MTHSIYDFPDLFRAIHMEQPHEIGQEAAFLRRLWQRHYQRRVRRVLDIASGDSPHGIILIRSGIKVVGVDRSATMLASGRSHAAGSDSIKFYRRPIERFSLPEKPFDCAFFMSETFPIMTTNRAILGHLKSVARLLKRGGLYCIDIDRQDGLRAFEGRRLWRERRVRTLDADIEVREYQVPAPWYAGTYFYELCCKIRYVDDTIISTRDLVPVHYTLPSHLELAARASGSFAMVACYADLSLKTPLERCDRRWIAVLRRI